MPRIEGKFAIFPTDDGLLVLIPEPEGEQVRYYFNDHSEPYLVSREMEGYLTLRPELDGEDTFHFSRGENASTRVMPTTKVQ